MSTLPLGSLSNDELVNLAQAPPIQSRSKPNGKGEPDELALNSEWFTEGGNAERFFLLHGQRLRYIPQWKAWFIWDGTCWQRDESLQVIQMAKDVILKIYKDASEIQDYETRMALVKHAIKSDSKRHYDAIISLVSSRPPIPVLPNQFDSDPWLLNVRNGTVELRTGKFRESRYNDLISKQCPIVFDPDATCPTWKYFLSTIIEDEKVIEFIQRAVGYSLTGDISEQCLFLLYGTGSNGKSTFIETLRSMLGNYAMRADFTTFLAKESDTVRNDLARMKGARFVSAVEMGEGRRLSEPLIKQLTGGDTIAARFLYGEFFEFVPIFKLFLAANHKPNIRETDHGTWRRIRLIPFTVTIDDRDQDKSLPQKLQDEFPGILNWAIEGCLRWQRDGLQPPEGVVSATREYRDEMDNIGQFISETCTLGDFYNVEASLLYHEYKSWSEKNGEYVLSQTRFGRKLRERGLEKSRRSGSGRKIYIGIALVSKSTQDDGNDENFNF